MNAYSEDLRKKIVEALCRGMGKSQAARSFGVSLSSVKRYAKMADEGRPLAPKKMPGSRPKTGQDARRLLEADLEERPAAPRFPRGASSCRGRAGSRLASPRSPGCSSGWASPEKKGCGCERARRVYEGGLEDAGCRGTRRRAPGLRGRDGREYLAFAPLRLVAVRGEGAR